MSNHELDAVDRGILHLLQEDARNNSPADIAEIVGVAPNTVRNRLEQLEDTGVISGYYPHIDYEQASYQLRVWFFCTVPISDRTEIADKLLAIDGVTQVEPSSPFSSAARRVPRRRTSTPVGRRATRRANSRGNCPTGFPRRFRRTSS